jgi:hypothetical protein
LGITLAVAKKPRQKNPGSSFEPPGAINISNIRLEPLENAAVYYVNYIEVGASPQDFSIICARLPAKLSGAKKEEVKELGALVIEPEVQVVIPVTLVPGIIRALTTQKEIYEKLYGIQIKEVERQHE